MDDSSFVNATAKYNGQKVFSINQKIQTPRFDSETLKKEKLYFKFKLINSNNFFAVHLIKNSGYLINLSVKNNTEIFEYTGVS